MGMLAVWGGVSGLGRGIELKAQDQGKQEDFDRQAAKEARLQLLAHQYRSEEQGAEFKHQDVTTEKTIGAEKEITGIKETGENTRSGAQIQAQKDIAEKHEKGATERSATSAGARKYAADVSAAARVAAAGASEKAKHPRWSYQKYTMQGTVDKAGNLIPGAQVSVLTDNEQHHQYMQVGEDKYVPWEPGDPMPSSAAAHRRAAATEVQKLLENPGQVDNFLKTYGYLPKAWVERAQAGGSAPMGGMQPSGPIISFGPTGTQEDNGQDDEDSEE